MEFSESLTDRTPDPDPVEKKLRQTVRGNIREYTRHAWIDFSSPGFDIPPNFDWEGVAELLLCCKKLETLK